MEKVDCFGYKEKGKYSGCKTLKQLYCREGECKFYRTDINEGEIEQDIRNYANTYKN